ncbi:MAG: hypothetical protein R3B55_03455 [Candidatus Paceibacterota bacterium]
MKFYFASRFKKKNELLRLRDSLEKEKHKVISSWIDAPSLKPYSDNKKKCSLMAKKIESEIKKCDVFVLLSDKSGTDMFVELGIAAALKKKIYIIGKHNQRSLMHFHPLFKHVDSVEKLFEMLHINI